MLGIGMDEDQAIGLRRIVDHPLAPLGAAGNLFAHEALDWTVTVKAAEIFEPCLQEARREISVVGSKSSGIARPKSACMSMLSNRV
jgi:hypothetical protein